MSLICASVLSRQSDGSPRIGMSRVVTVSQCGSTRHVYAPNPKAPRPEPSKNRRRVRPNVISNSVKESAGRKPCTHQCGNGEGVFAALPRQRIDDLLPPLRGVVLVQLPLTLDAFNRDPKADDLID